MTSINRPSDGSPFFSYDIFDDEENGEEEGEEENQDFSLPDDVYDTDNESADEEAPTYLQQLPLEKSVDFFEELGIVLSLDALLSDETPEMEQSMSEMSEGFDIDTITEADQTDLLLTEADDALSKQSKMSLALEIPPSVSFFESTQGEPSDAEGSEDLEELLLPDEPLAEVKSSYKMQDADDALNLFLELETEHNVVVFQDVDWDLIAKQEEAEIMHQTALAFITNLINQVVEIVESKSPQEILRQNIDKHIVIEHLWKYYAEVQIEKNLTTFLNRRAVEFYRRKKIMRPILPDKLKNLSVEIDKHKAALEHLDNLLGEEESKNKVKNQKTRELEKELHSFHAEAQEEIHKFENLVKETLMKESRPKLNALLEKLLAVMTRLRKQISNLRFELIMKQDTQASLKEALHQMENLGDGLTLKSFTTLQTETHALDKKLEERNNELNKLHIRMRDDIHHNSHYKEKQKMLRNTLAVQRMALEELYDEKNEWREKIHLLKVKRLQIRSQIKELSYKGGLVDKPALLYDYDKTVEKIERIKETNNYLRGKQQDLQQQIDALMEHVSTPNTLERK